MPEPTGGTADVEGGLEDEDGAGGGLEDDGLGVADPGDDVGAAAGDGGVPPPPEHAVSSSRPVSSGSVFARTRPRCHSTRVPRGRTRRTRG
ncbi:hypothetical protein DMP23_36325 [Amycolatopsis sp. A1MSW2902]